MSQDIANVEEEKKSDETGLATETKGLDVEKIFKEYIIPTLDDIWVKFKINAKESLSASETLFYTVKNWWGKATNSYVYLIASNTTYYLGGWIFKKGFYDPAEYFLGGVVSFIPKWFKEVGVKGYTETTEILTSIRDWLIYPTLEGVIFLDKTMGSAFYVFALPVVFLYKNLAFSYYMTQNGIEKFRYWLYDYLYSTKLPEDSYEEEEEEEEDEGEKEEIEEEIEKDTRIDNKPNLGWKLAETAIPTLLIVGTIVWGFKKIFRKK